MTRALFLSLDGVDGSGKSTQARLLADWLSSQGKTVVPCQDPGGTEVGSVLRNLLLEHRGLMSLPCEALLFLASRAQLVDEVIRPALAQGHIVLCDRFALANVVYQGHAGGLDPERIADMSRFATGELEPDLTFVLDVPLTVARSRRKAQPDRLEARDEDFHERVRTGFQLEACRQPDRIRLIDASQSPDIVQQLIRQEIAAYGLEPRARS